MPGVKALRKIQIGEENTAGTAVAATSILRMEGTAEDLTEVMHAAEDVGFLSYTDRTYIPSVGGRLPLSGAATFEQLPYILMMGVDDVTATGATTSKTRAFVLCTSGQEAPQSYTLEFGDDQQAEEMAYCFCEDFEISGAMGEAVMMSATIRGRQISTTTFTGSLSLPSVEEILASKAKLYIDAGGGTIGSTQKTGTLLSFALRITTGFQPVRVGGDGELYFDSVKNVAPEVLLEITFEHEGTAVAEKAAWLAETTRLIRLSIEGTDCGDGTNRKLEIDIAGRWESFSALADSDGNDTVTGTLRGRWSNTDSLFCEITVINALATLP
jgi:hypothetical protein